MSELVPNIDDETLVAYLDGELSKVDSEKLSSRIAVDLELKRRVDALRSSWELLDELPVANPNPQLAQTTIELVTQGLGKSTPERLQEYLHRFRWVAVALASIFSVLCGLWLARLQANQFEQSLVDNLIVLVNFRELDNIDSADWLDKLATIEGLEKAGLPLHIETSFPELPKQQLELKSWVNSLDTNQNLALQAAYRKFTSSEPLQRQNKKAIADRLSSIQADSSSSLIKAYAGLIQRISIVEAEQIKAEEDLNKRAGQVQEVVRRELAIAYANNLSDDEKSRIVDWCDNLKERNLDYFLNSDDPDGEIVRLLDIETVDSNIRPSDIEQLIQCVQAEGRQLLQDLNTSLQTKVLKLWVYNSLPSTQRRPQISAAELLDRFRKLTPQAQNELIFAPSSKVIKTLTQNSPQPENTPNDPRSSN